MNKSSGLIGRKRHSLVNTYKGKQSPTNIKVGEHTLMSHDKAKVKSNMIQVNEFDDDVLKSGGPKYLEESENMTQTAEHGMPLNAADASIQKINLADCEGRISGTGVFSKPAVKKIISDGLNSDDKSSINDGSPFVLPQIE